MSTPHTRTTKIDFRQNRFSLRRRPFVICVASALLTICSCSFEADDNETGSAETTQIVAQGYGFQGTNHPISPKQIDDRPPPTAAAKQKEAKDAERIFQLKKSIEDDRKSLLEIQKKLNDPKSELREAEKKFDRLDTQVKTMEKEIKKRNDCGEKDEAKYLEAGLPPLRKQWKQAKAEVDLAITEWKTLQQKLAALKSSIPEEQKELDKLTGIAPPARTKPDGSQEKAQNPTARKTEPPTIPLTPAVPVPTQPIVSTTKPNEDKELTQAQKDAQKKEEEAKQAKDMQVSIAQQLENLRAKIDLERKLLDSARKKADLALETFTNLTKEIRKKEAGQAPRQEIDALAKNLTTAEEVLGKAQDHVQNVSDSLESVQRQYSNLLVTKLAAVQETQLKQAELERAQKKVATLQNPFTWRNIQAWLLNHGLKIVAILIGMIVLNRVVRLVSHRVVNVMIERGRKRNGDEERHDRIETLANVFRNGLNIAIIIGGVLMILDEVGVSIIPLMGGAAIIGLAVAFAVQNLLRDYFTGFNILLEDQYGIKDVIKIGEIAGIVERITLRVTTLRDLDGVLHFVPHGTITTVSNMSHGWARAKFDIGVAYKENVDRVMTILMELGTELRNDPDYKPLILEDPEMLGVEMFGDSAIVIRFLIKVRPLKQWMVRRELLRRIKKRFDELDIEIPFPHRTVYHHHEVNAPPALIQN